ncbi:hypothetical protein RRG08_035494 [Elysia crispata]|uniref:Uncharacterized protein n=1 Tax=Elysia crispata TaxID=231223 RepID=A0AAE1ARI9_9GAST|nr:hypothetical protein RRG08_035494 [Elysia crispata]
MKITSIERKPSRLLSVSFNKWAGPNPVKTRGGTKAHRSSSRLRGRQAGKRDSENLGDQPLSSAPPTFLFRFTSCKSHP